MTEYSHSLQGRDRYFSHQNRISNWVVETEEHRAQFGNASTMPPSIASSTRASNRSSHQRSSTAPSFPCSSMSSTTILDDESHKVAREPMSQHGTAAPVPSHLSHPRDDHSHKPQSHSSFHRRSSSQPQAPRSRKSKTSPTYIVTIPPTTSPTYTYGPSGWIPSAGLVIISSKRKKVSTLVSGDNTFCVRILPDIYIYLISTHNLNNRSPQSLVLLPNFTNVLHALRPCMHHSCTLRHSGMG